MVWRGSAVILDAPVLLVVASSRLRDLDSNSKMAMYRRQVQCNSRVGLYYLKFHTQDIQLRYPTATVQVTAH